MTPSNQVQKPFRREIELDFLRTPFAVPIWVGIVPAVLGIGIGWLTTKAVKFPFLRLRDRVFPRKVDSAVGIPAEIEVREPTAHPA